MTKRSAHGARRARRRATLVSAIATTLILGCAPALSDAEHSVYPRFSLVGELPQRVTEFELTIDAPDIAAIHKIISADEGPHTVQLRPGEERFIELLAVDDVYSGSVTADFPNPGEYAVTIPMLPGPVIPDPGNERLVQIRDMSGAGRRGLGADVLDGFQPRDAAYDDNGYLWVANGGGGTYGLLRIDDLSGEPGVEGFLDGIGVEALAVDFERGRVYFWGALDQGVGLYYLDVDSGELSDSIVTALELGIELDLVEDAEAHVSGLDVDDDGYLVAALNVEDFDNWFWVVRFDPEANGAVVEDSLDSEALSWDNITPESALQVVRDVLIDGEYVFGTLAVDIPDVDYDNMVRFSVDFDPDSVEAVTVEGGDFLGPQRFVAQRGEGELIIVTDWDGNPENARLIAFVGIEAENWDGYADYNSPFEFFELFEEMGVVL